MVIPIPSFLLFYIGSMLSRFSELIQYEKLFQILSSYSDKLYMYTWETIIDVQYIHWFRILLFSV